jgi:dUTP pyrophosphatase
MLPGSITIVPCGFAVAIPDGFEGQVRPRSGLAAKAGITVLNAPGTIDADYRGEIKVCLINHGSCDFEITRGSRIAQLVIVPVPKVIWQETDSLPASVRDQGGFGHTGA